MARRAQCRGEGSGRGREGECVPGGGRSRRVGEDVRWIGGGGGLSGCGEVSCRRRSDWGELGSSELWKWRRLEDGAAIDGGETAPKRV